MIRVCEPCQCARKLDETRLAFIYLTWPTAHVNAFNLCKFYLSTRVLFHFYVQEGCRKIGGSQDFKPVRQAMIQLKVAGSQLPSLYKLDSLPNLTLYCPILESLSKRRTVIHGRLQPINTIHQFSVITVLNTSDEVLPLALQYRPKLSCKITSRTPGLLLQICLQAYVTRYTSYCWFLIKVGPHFTIIWLQ
jgi:hypothetical protein